MSKILRTVTAALVSGVVFSGAAHAGFFANNTGLVNPAEVVDFTSFGLTDNQQVTNQAASFGVTFAPFVYFNPQAGFFPNGRVGNFTFATEPAFVNPVTLSFSGPLTSAAFQMAADDTPYTFIALLNGVAVDSGTATVPGTDGQFFGFTGDNFNAIEILQSGVGGGPYWLIGNLQFGSSLVTAPPTGVPEPASVALLSAGFLGLAAARRRKRS